MIALYKLAQEFSDKLSRQSRQFEKGDIVYHQDPDLLGMVIRSNSEKTLVDFAGGLRIIPTTDLTFFAKQNELKEFEQEFKWYPGPKDLYQVLR